jgi:hypothetical protein
MDIFEFCIFYVICFTALFSLTPLGTFPPRDISFYFPSIAGVTGAYLWSFPWAWFIAGLSATAIVAIILIVVLGNIQVAATGPGINTKYLSTLVAGFTISAGLGVSLQQMLPGDVPPIATFLLVWVWIILLVYSVIIYAGTGSTT